MKCAQSIDIRIIGDMPPWIGGRKNERSKITPENGLELLGYELLSQKVFFLSLLYSDNLLGLLWCFLFLFIAFFFTINLKTDGL